MHCQGNWYGKQLAAQCINDLMTGKINVAKIGRVANSSGYKLK